MEEAEKDSMLASDRAASGWNKSCDPDPVCVYDMYTAHICIYIYIYIVRAQSLDSPTRAFDDYAHWCTET